jgi:hypothetical protein
MSPNDATSIGPPDTAAIARVLRAAQGPLYAVLDAARDGWILSRLMTSTEQYRSLYEGESGDSLAPVAPYLVQLSPGGALLDLLVTEGWGRSWGVYLSSRADFAEVRRHLRRFLIVQHEDGRELYFRFYDPRVMRAFVPSCTLAEARDFFGPLDTIWSEEKEGAEAGMLEFAVGVHRLEVRRPMGGG